MFCLRSEHVDHIGWWGDKSSRTLHYSPFTPNRLMHFLAHLGERMTLRGLTEGELIGRAQFGEAWIREHHEVGSRDFLLSEHLVVAYVSVHE